VDTKIATKKEMKKRKENEKKKKKSNMWLLNLLQIKLSIKMATQMHM
jgi:hypothetical protein